MKTRALFLVLPLLAAACRDNRASVQIQEICVPTDDCTFSGECEAQYIGFASIDAAVTGRMWLLMQVENQLEDNGNLGVGRLNTNDAHIDEASIAYEGVSLPAATYQLPGFHVPAATAAVVSVDIFPPALNAQGALAAYAPTATPRDMVAKVRLRGYYDDGTRFETGEFIIGIRVCSGCVGAAACGALGTCPPNSSGFLPLVCRQ